MANIYWSKILNACTGIVGACHFIKLPKLLSCIFLKTFQSMFSASCLLNNKQLYTSLCSWKKECPLRLFNLPRISSLWQLYLRSSSWFGSVKNTPLEKIQCHQSLVSVVEHSTVHCQFAPPPLTEKFPILLNFHSNIKNLLDGIFEAMEVVVNQPCEGKTVEVILHCYVLFQLSNWQLSSAIVKFGQKWKSKQTFNFPKQKVVLHTDSLQIPSSR